MRVLVTGPPAAGKSTVAKIVAESVGGPVIDYDVVARLFGSTGHDHTADVGFKANAETLRQARETQGPAVLIRSAPGRAEREAMAREFDADAVLVIPTPAEVAKARAVRDARPQWTAGAIDRWWSRFEPSPMDARLDGVDELPAFLAGLRPREAVNSRSDGGTVSDATVNVNTSESAAPDGNDTTGTTSTGADEFKPITSQDDLNRVLADRISRERAKFADYKDVKAKASRLDELEQANKTEIEKATDRVAKAEAEVAAVPTRVAEHLRAHLIELHGINGDDAELFLTANDPTLLLKQVTRLVGRTQDRKKQGNHVPREGTTTTAPESDERETARKLFGGLT